jgi:hypothetical protein
MGSKGRKRGRKRKSKPPRPRGRPRAGETLVDRLERRRADLKTALVELLEIEQPASARTLRERPAIEAEIWGVEAQIALERNDLARARHCNTESQRCAAEARKAISLDTAARVAKLEDRFGLGSELGEQLDHLR